MYVSPGKIFTYLYHNIAFFCMYISLVSCDRVEVIGPHDTRVVSTFIDEGFVGSPLGDGSVGGFG